MWLASSLPAVRWRENSATATPARTVEHVRRDGTASSVTVLELASGIVPVREVRLLSNHSRLCGECVFSLKVMILKSYWVCQRVYWSVGKVPFKRGTAAVLLLRAKKSIWWVCFWDSVVLCSYQYVCVGHKMQNEVVLQSWTIFSGVLKMAALAVM